MPVFKLYDCKVRLQGSVLNEVPKQRVTAPEIEMYRALHGGDAVVDIKEVGSEKRSDKSERARLLNIFANPAKSVGESLKKKVQQIRDLFGHDSNPLPTAIVAAVDPADDEDLEEEAGEVVEPIERTKVVGSQPSFTE